MEHEIDNLENNQDFLYYDCSSIDFSKEIIDGLMVESEDNLRLNVFWCTNVRCTNYQENVYLPKSIDVYYCKDCSDILEYIEEDNMYDDDIYKGDIDEYT